MYCFLIEQWKQYIYQSFRELVSNLWGFVYKPAGMTKIENECKKTNIIKPKEQEVDQPRTTNLRRNND
jgi:hypothetical protein